MRCTISRPFWDHSLTLVKKERTRLWKAVTGHNIGSAEAVFLESKAREVQKRLKSEVRLRKRQGFVALAGNGFKASYRSNEADE